jgi:purine-binding chemotaxis protein CheW
MTTRKLSTFWVGDDLFGVAVEDVQEVTRSHEVTPVPLAPAAVSGLMNLRGQVITVVDLRSRLGYPPRAAGAPTANVVVRADGSAAASGGTVSLLVDRVEGFEDVTGEQFAERPDTVTGPARQLVTGAYKLPGRLLLALDLHRAIDLAGAA